MWRNISIIAACLAVLAATLLLMGNLQSGTARTAQLEQSRLDAMASRWEMQLEVARSAFHDQAVRHDLLAALSHPEEWSPSRVQTKFEAIRSSWAKENGTLLAVALFNPDGRLHTADGDTARLSEATAILLKSDGTDALLLGCRGTQPAVLAVQFYSPPSSPGARAGCLVALIDPSTVLNPGADGPSEWILLSGPHDTLLCSGEERTAPQISEAMWTLMLSQQTGIVRRFQGLWCFARIEIPGMQRMLLVHHARAHAAPAGVVIAILSLAAVSWLFRLAWQGTHASTRDTSAPAPTHADEPADTTGYRQIVHQITDPICVVDQSGAVLKANRAAQEWLHLHRGRPDDSLTVENHAGEFTAVQFLRHAGEQPAQTSGECRLSFQGDVRPATVEVSRLYRDEEGHGPVMLHFRARALEERAPEKEETAPETESAPDPHSPFPVLSVSSDGLIVAYNEAARRACARLEDTPLLSDILPGMDGRHLSEVLEGGEGTVFQSLFGPRTHEFTVVFDGAQILLYAHPLTDSQNLEIELKQAQESFFTLCALVPSPVLLVDPREHTVIEANAAAGDLFERPAAGLRGQSLDSLSADPWEFTQGHDLFIAQTLRGGRVPCMLRYELIKLEGAPALMVVLEPEQENMAPSTEVPVAADAEPPREPASSAPRVLRLGPGMLIALDPTVREVARRLLDKSGHACEAFTNLDDAVVWLITHGVRPEFLALDMTDFDAVDVWVSDLRARCGDVPCIAFTDGETYDLPDDGPNVFLAKPFDWESFQDALSGAHLRVPSYAVV
jgi:PAS domain-containing protein